MGKDVTQTLSNRRKGVKERRRRTKHHHYCHDRVPVLLHTRCNRMIHSRVKVFSGNTFEYIHIYFFLFLLLFFFFLIARSRGKRYFPRDSEIGIAWTKRSVCTNGCCQIFDEYYSSRRRISFIVTQLNWIVVIKSGVYRAILTYDCPHGMHGISWFWNLIFLKNLRICWNNCHFIYFTLWKKCFDQIIDEICV